MSDEALAKINHALEHRDALMAEQERSRQLREYTLVFEHNSNEVTNPWCWAQWRVDDPGEPLPTRLGLILGDLVHNLRSALDYAAFAAATSQARQHRGRDLQFPIYTDRAAFDRKVPQLRTLHPANVVEAFRQSQPYLAPANHLHPLAVLQALSNGDKHRQLQIVRRAQMDLGDVTIYPAPDVEIISTIGSRPIDVDEVVARIDFRRPTDFIPVKISSRIGWYEAVEFEHDGAAQWLRIDEMINAICPEVLDKVLVLHQLANGTAAEQ